MKFIKGVLKAVCFFCYFTLRLQSESQTGIATVSGAALKKSRILPNYFNNSYRLHNHNFKRACKKNTALLHHPLMPLWGSLLNITTAENIQILRYQLAH